VTALNDKYTTTAADRIAAVSATACSIAGPAGREPGTGATARPSSRRSRRYLLITRLTAASKNAISPAVSVCSHGAEGQYGLASEPPKLATRHAPAQQRTDAQPSPKAADSTASLRLTSVLSSTRSL